MKLLIDHTERFARLCCATMWPETSYAHVKPETSYAHVRLFGRRKDEEKFNQIVYMNYKLEDFIYLLDVINSVYDKVIANEPLCNVL